MWVWLCPNYLLAIYKVVSTEVPLFRWLTHKEVHPAPRAHAA